MKKILKLTSLLLCLITVFSVFTACGEAEKVSETQTETETEAQTEAKIMKVACIGDSITYGVGATDRETTSYPALLGDKLGDNYIVEGFGLSGSTAICKDKWSEVHTPYIKSAEFADAIEFCPDIVVMMLGTNDTCLFLLGGKKYDKFKEDYSAIVDEFKKVNPEVKFFFMKPCDLVTYDNKYRKVLEENIPPIIDEIASTYNGEVIDLYALTKGKKELYTDDGCHPNDDGYEVIATEVYNAITAFYNN